MCHRLAAVVVTFLLMVASVNAREDPAPKASDQAPKVELLWPLSAPGALGAEEKDKPTLTVYLPPAERANGTAVVICPGGGYGFVAIDHEGKQPAEWLNSLG